MFDSFDDLIQVNNRALQALSQCVERLNRMTVGAFPAEFAMLQAHIGRVTKQIDLLIVINAHLEAANVPFSPLGEETEQRLRQAFDRIDRAIIQDAIVTATLDTINDVFSAAARISNITNGAA
jgi:hypothetical protein